jgi:succinate dehydrogenase/fumarate reductase flavoprotein subunit
MAWDDSADVVVVGFGAAGVATALTAARRGADVLVLERQAATAHTPSAKAAAAFVLTVTDVEQGARYLDRCAAGTTPYAVSRAWAALAADLEGWLREACPGITSAPGEGMHGVAAHADFDGADAVRTLQFTVPGSTGRPGAELFVALAESAGATGRVRVAWNHRGRRLVRDDAGRVAGLDCALPDGSVRRIRARRGVVLTTGGFENDQGLVRQYLRAAPMYFAGNPDNTGDGLRMAQAAGAGLWHMNGAEGRQVGRFDLGDGRWLAFQMALPPGGYVVLDGAGRRFCDEHRYTRIHTVWYELLAYDVGTHTYPRIPAYWVFDARRFTAGPLVSSMIGPVSMGLYTWSPDNTAELARGWISAGATATELGTALGMARPDAVDEAVADYNAGCAIGEDAFGRPASSLVPLQPPFYAVPLYPGGVGTMGGPEHDEHGRVLDPFGDPIGGLYSAGSVGQMIGDLYPAPGSGWSEALCAGRMAGAAAATGS